MANRDDNSQKYVYGVMEASAAPQVTSPGIGGGAVGTTTAADLAALTSDVPDGEMEVGREELLGHARVLEEALAAGTVLPMRFGVAMPDEDTVRQRLLEQHREELLTRLEELEGAVELNLRAIYDEQVIMREVVSENGAVAELRESLRGKPEEATYYERIRLGEMVGESVSAKRDEDSRRIVGRLEPLAIDVQIGEPAHERMALNASFLVERARVGEFDRAVDEIGAEQGDRMRLKYTGPLPPHSFVELSLED